MAGELPIEFSPHALEQMAERGVSREEVITAIRRGEKEPAQKGRSIFRKNFTFEKIWRGKRYTIKQVTPVVARESEGLIVVTVYTYYF